MCEAAHARTIEPSESTIPSFLGGRSEGFGPLFLSGRGLFRF